MLKKLNRFEETWHKANVIPATSEMCCVAYTWTVRGIKYTEYGTARHHAGYWAFTRRVPRDAKVLRWQFMSVLPESFRSYIVPLSHDDERKTHTRSVWRA